MNNALAQKQRVLEPPVRYCTFPMLLTEFMRRAFVEAEDNAMLIGGENRGVSRVSSWPSANTWLVSTRLYLVRVYMFARVFIYFKHVLF